MCLMTGHCPQVPLGASDSNPWDPLRVSYMHQINSLKCKANSELKKVSDPVGWGVSIFIAL